MNAKPLILLVDDNDLLRVACKLAFERAGFDVLLARDGAAGLDSARARVPDLVLLDLHMPRLNGWQTARVLTRDSRTAGVPVVAFTGARDASTSALRAAGFRAHADKGEPLDRLIGLVRLCLSDERRDEGWVESTGPDEWRVQRVANG